MGAAENTASLKIMMVMIMENATSGRGGRYRASLAPLLVLICTKDVRGRKMITITNTHLQGALFPREVSV